MEGDYTRRKMNSWTLLFAIFFYFRCGQCDIILTDDHELNLKLNEVSKFSINASFLSNISNTEIQLIVQHSDIIRLDPTILNITEGIHDINVTALGAGHSEVYANASDPAFQKHVKDLFLIVTVYKQDWLIPFSVVIGWIYFVAWSISFYPQIYINWKRKSVVGLNFDFIILNIVGFTLYGIFNLGLFFIPEIQNEYSDRHPRGMNPVKVNDIVFAVHAAIATLITIVQCFIYEREEQRVSTTARTILGIFGGFLTISIILAGVKVIHWLDYLYYCSYVKLTITLIKYIPQAYMNYKRKSTVGWSIGNIFLDFTGGALSMLQMIVDAYNYDDWVSIFGDPTKFGLGLFSVVFDIFFIVQHYILYRHSNYAEN
ncbi:cystinosin isoform X2 [Leptinotarsa decemlineata]|uniref:cystinosin isoform X2 n=1 Tax=Leptinotarsa decemlineata TaxID=7539 RepID=UPI003D30BFC9